MLSNVKADHIHCDLAAIPYPHLDTITSNKNPYSWPLWSILVHSPLPLHGEHLVVSLSSAMPLWCPGSPCILMTIMKFTNSNVHCTRVFVPVLWSFSVSLIVANLLTTGLFQTFADCCQTLCSLCQPFVTSPFAWLFSSFWQLAISFGLFQISPITACLGSQPYSPSLFGSSSLLPGPVPSWHPASIYCSLLPLTQKLALQSSYYCPCSFPINTAYFLILTSSPLISSRLSRTLPMGPCIFFFIFCSETSHPSSYPFFPLHNLAW